MDVVVVGGGLAGLTAAEALHGAGLSVTVVEARPRVGGRLLTVAPEATGGNGWIDLGATWHWSDQPAIRSLADDLGVATFDQYASGRGVLEESVDEPPTAVEVPRPSPVERRFVGGAEPLCHELAARLAPGSVMLATSVTEVRARDAGMRVAVAGPTGEGSELDTRFVVVALPPRLALERITFDPPLDDDLMGVMRRTTTWMATAVKCVALYRSSFWRSDGLSGFAYSRTGPLREVHDACTHDGSLAALWGFVAGDDAFRGIGADERRELVVAQLGRLFGPAAADPVQYLERDWSADANTIDDEWWWVDGEPLPYGDAVLTRPLLDARLVWAGAETAAVGGGHMEGAVRSGRRAARLVAEAAGVAPG
jgi:monoamine oxidase